MSEDKINNAPHDLCHDFCFILSECERVQTLLRNLSPKDISKQLGDIETLQLVMADKHKKMTCSRAGFSTLHSIAKTAARKKSYSGRVDLEGVYKAIQFNYVRAFLEQRQEITKSNIDRVISSSLKWAQKSCSDQTHFIPCRLMYAEGPKEFSIGPVKFISVRVFMQQLDQMGEAYLKADPAKKEIAEMLLGDARKYYEEFTWIGVVKVLDCAPKSSEERALRAVVTAVDTLHVVFGSYYTHRMAVSGPPLRDDRRARLYLDMAGKLEVSCSSSTTSAVGFGGDWGRFLQDERALLNKTALNSAK